MNKFIDVFDRLGILVDPYLEGNESIEHHGIQGQKWGVMHGPPYPLDSNSAKQAKKKAKAAANAIKETSEKVAKVVSKVTKKTVKSIKEASEESRKRRAERAVQRAIRKKEKADAKAAEKQKAYDDEKKRIIDTGDIQAASKRATDFTNEEIQQMVERYASLSKVHDIGTLDQADEFIRKSRTDEERMTAIKKISTGDLEWATENPGKLTQNEMDDLIRKYEISVKARDWKSDYDTKRKTETFDRINKRSKSASETAGSLVKLAGNGIAFYSVLAEVHNKLYPENQWVSMGTVANAALNSFGKGGSLDAGKLAETLVKNGISGDKDEIIKVIKEAIPK